LRRRDAKMLQEIHRHPLSAWRRITLESIAFISGIIQAWAVGASEKQYRALAGRTAAAQSASQEALSAIQAQLSRMASSLVEIEKILKQAE
jgi:hypothetical protein